MVAFTTQCFHTQFYRQINSYVMIAEVANEPYKHHE